MDFKPNEISGNTFVHLQTLEIENTFKTSRPRPRNKAMGFRPDLEKSKPRPQLTDEDFMDYWKNR